MKYWLTLLFLLQPLVLSAFSLSDGAEAYSTVVETHHKLNNMYFYASIGLLMITLPAIGRIKRGGELRPGLSKAVASLVHTVRIICILFLVIHFSPETESIINWILDFIGRIFE